MVAAKKQKDFITLEQAYQLNKFMKGIEVYKPITILKKITGYGLIGIGAITLPLPTGSIFLIMAGCALLAINYERLINTLNFYAKETGYWVWRILR